MLREGSRLYNSSEIAEKLDFYGCTLHLSPGADTSSLILYSLNKHLSKVLPIIESLLSTPLFPKQDLTTSKKEKSGSWK